jgi:hypothetical protein
MVGVAWVADANFPTTPEDTIEDVNPSYNFDGNYQDVPVVGVRWVLMFGIGHWEATYHGQQHQSWESITE